MIFLRNVENFAPAIWWRGIFNTYFTEVAFVKGQESAVRLPYCQRVWPQLAQSTLSGNYLRLLDSTIISKNSLDFRSR